MWGPARSRIGPHGTLQRNVGVLLGTGAGEEFRGWVEGRVTGSVESALEGVQAAGWALYAEGTGVASLPAQRATTDVVLLSGGGSGWLLNPGGTTATVSLVGYGADGRRVGSRTVAVGGRRRVRLEEVAPEGTEMVLLRATAAVVGYEEGVDGSGVSRAQGAAAVPAATGAVVLSEELGGVVLAGDARASVAVPLGALSQDTVIAIESLRAEETPLPPLGKVVLAAVRVSPLGLRFGEAVRVEMPVLRTAPLPAGTRLLVYDPATRAYEQTAYEVASGVGGTTVVASVREFPSGPLGTLWVVLGTAVGTPAGGGGGGGTVSSGGSGGVVTSGDGQTSVVVPPGAVPQSTTITVANVEPNTLPPPPNQQTVVLAAEVGPSGTQFQTPVVLEFQVPQALQGSLPQQLPGHLQPADEPV